MSVGGSEEVLELRLYVQLGRPVSTTRYMRLSDVVQRMVHVRPEYTRVASIKIVLDGRRTRGCRITGYTLVLETMSAFGIHILGDTINTAAELLRMRLPSKRLMRGRLQMCFCKSFLLG